MAFALLGTLGSYYWRENPSNRTTWLVIVTTLFHAWIDPLGAVFLWFLAWLVRFFAKRIESSENPLTRRTRTRVAVVGVIVPLVLWRSAQELLDFASGLGLTDVALDTVWRPVALGLILLQAVITIVDVSRKDAPTPSLRETVLLLGFYPRALAGPLVRTGSFCYNLQQKWTGEIPLGKVAMLIVSAAFQRYVIVESLARYGQSMSANRENLNMFDALLWLASGPVRVVADITAYSYLAVAAALVCGVKLPYDMKSPFQGHTPGEFLRRWHVTVSGFFRDYAMPLFMGNTGSESRSFISVVATCSLIGFWRAPGLTSLLWGVMLGLPVAFETIRHRRRIMSGRRRAVTPQLRVRIPLIIITFAYYALISPLTASYSLTKLWDLYSSLFTRPVFAPMHAPLLAVVCVALALVLGSGSLSRAGACCERFLDKAPASVVGVFVAVCTSACAGFASVGIPMFLYQAV